MHNIESVSLTFDEGSVLTGHLVTVVIHNAPFYIFAGDEEVAAMKEAGIGEPVYVEDIVNGMIYCITKRGCGCYAMYDSCCDHTFEEDVEEDD